MLINLLIIVLFNTESVLESVFVLFYIKLVSV
jgi:hypothetical protein